MSQASAAIAICSPKQQKSANSGIGLTVRLKLCWNREKLPIVLQLPQPTSPPSARYTTAVTAKTRIPIRTALIDSSTTTSSTSGWWPAGCTFDGPFANKINRRMSRSFQLDNSVLPARLFMGGHLTESQCRKLSTLKHKRMSEPRSVATIQHREHPPRDNSRSTRKHETMHSPYRTF